MFASIRFDELFISIFQSEHSTFGHVLVLVLRPVWPFLCNGNVFY